MRLIIFAASVAMVGCGEGPTQDQESQADLTLGVTSVLGAPRPRSTAPPHLQNHYGPIIPNVQIYTVWWGTVPAARQIGAFYDAIAPSAYVSGLREYDEWIGSPPQHWVIGAGRHAGSATARLTGSHAIASAEIENALIALLRQGVLPSDRPGESLFAVHFAPGDYVVWPNAKTTCSAFCGYHDHFSFNWRDFRYSVVTDPGSCGGSCGSGFGALTMVASHELAEAITDPDPGAGWYDPAHGEIGDICAWKMTPYLGYVVQLEWSNRRSACVNPATN